MVNISNFFIFNLYKTIFLILQTVNSDYSFNFGYKLNISDCIHLHGSNFSSI